MQRTTSIQKETIEQFLETRKTNEESFYTHPSYRLEKELLYWLTQLNEEKALFTMSEINQLERATLSNNPLRSLKNSIICSCTLFARAAIEAGVVPEISFNLSDVFIRKVEKAESFEMLHAIEVEMLKYFIDAIRDYQKNPYQNEIVDQAIHYIHENILLALTLEEIAAQISVSPNYLSTLFHEVVGVTLKEYINRKKIDESIYFLKYTSSTILDISLLFNFCNQSYYTALFKRFYSLTPKAYKQQNMS